MQNLKLNLKLNKKAIIEDWIPLLVSMIIMVLVILFFMAIKTNDKDIIKNKFLENKQELEAYQSLNNYLRLYSDKIILTINGNYDINKLREETVIFFNSYYKNEKWRIRSVFEKKILDFYSSEARAVDEKSVNTEIPYFNKNIRVDFYYG